MWEENWDVAFKVIPRQISATQIIQTSDELLRREVAQDVNFPKEYDIYLNWNATDQVLVLWVVIVLIRKSYRIVRLVQLHISTGIGPDMLFSLKSLQET